MPKGRKKASTKAEITKARNAWIKNPNRETLHFTDCFGHEAEITPETKCVKAVHVRSGKGYRCGDDSKHYAVSENGYVISFESADRKPEVIGANSGRDYANLWTPIEKVSRVVWYSFAMSMDDKNRKEPKFFAIYDKQMQCQSTMCFTQKALKKLMRMKSVEHGGIMPRGNQPLEYEVHHIDQNTTNNALSNLELLPWYLHDQTPVSIHKAKKELEAKLGHMLTGGYISVVEHNEVTTLLENLGNFGVIGIPPYRGYYIIQINEPDHALSTEEWESARNEVINLYLMAPDAKGKITDITLANKDEYWIWPVKERD